MVDFWHGVLDVLVVAIPVSIVSLSSFFGVHFWQIKKHKHTILLQKIELRKEIQDEFNKSLGAEQNVYNAFIDKMRNHYLVNCILVSEKEKNVNYTTAIPSGKENLPLNVFKEDLKKFNETLLKLDGDVNQFYSKIMVYFDSEELLKGYGELLRNDFFVRHLIIVLVHSKDGIEFQRNLIIIESAQIPLLQSSANFSKLLANTKLKKSPD